MGILQAPVLLILGSSPATSLAPLQALLDQRIKQRPIRSVPISALRQVLMLWRLLLLLCLEPAKVLTTKIEKLLHK